MKRERPLIAFRVNPVAGATLDRVWTGARELAYRSFPAPRLAHQRRVDTAVAAASAFKPARRAAISRTGRHRPSQNHRPFQAGVGIKSPFAEPTPTVKIFTPSFAAAFAAASSLPSRSSPSVT